MGPSQNLVQPLMPRKRGDGQSEGEPSEMLLSPGASSEAGGSNFLMLAGVNAPCQRLHLPDQINQLLG